MMPQLMRTPLSRPGRRRPSALAESGMPGPVGTGDAAGHDPVMNRQPLAVHAVRIRARSKLGTGSVVPLPGIVRPETGDRPGRENRTIRRSARTSGPAPVPGARSPW
jgi:hypothetical protein